MPMDPTTAAALFNPQVAADQQALARNMAIAQFLRQQSMTQQDAQGTGGIASPTSPLAAIARVLMGIQANKLDTQNDSDRLRMAQMVAAGMRQALPELGDQPSGPGLTIDGVSAPAQSSGPGVAPVRFSRETTIRSLVDPQGGLEAQKVEAGNQAYTPEQKNVRDPITGKASLYNLTTQNFTPLQKLLLARDKASPADAKDIAAAIAKENYIAPIDAKPGTPVIDPVTHELIAYAPKTADGMTLDFAKLNGALMPTQARAIPGYAGGNASIVGPESAARSANSIINVQGPGGESVPAWAGGAAAVGGSQLGLGGPAGAGRGSVNPPAVPKLGQGTGARTTQEGAAKEVQTLPMQVAQAKSTANSLEGALSTLQGLNTGPGSKGKFTVLGFVQQLGIPLAAGDTSGYQTLSKFLNRAATDASIANGSNGSDARFQQMMAGMPNAESMNPQALEKAIRYVLGQQDAAVARGAYVQQRVQQLGNDPNASQKALAEWSQSFNPRLFEFSRMSQADQVQAVKSMSATERAKFQKEYNAAHQQGWVQ